MTHFGEHLTFDGYHGDHAALNCRETVTRALSDLVAALKMTILGGPVIYLAQGNDKKDPGGWTGVVVLEESHISIHTFPARGFISADVYTCQNGLDVETIKHFFRTRFKTSDEEVNFIMRGTRYPQNNIYLGSISRPPERRGHRMGQDRRLGLGRRMNQGTSTSPDRRINPDQRITLDRRREQDRRMGQGQWGGQERQVGT